ncbi:hypothetical protein ACT3UJ_02470 [Halomonas sp. 86]|uniref:hypothetical protein n=1 Tax=unclassified Halomonas TaxID=2609666 RepID=UPI004033D861
MDYKATLWRKSLERRGWRRFGNYTLPRCMIEYHVIHRGKLYSGRCYTTSLPGDRSQPGTAAYVIQRRDMMTEGVWRRTRDDAPVGQIVRPLPY